MVTGEGLNRILVLAGDPPPFSRKIVSILKILKKSSGVMLSVKKSC
jgi:hypothetical protein